MSDPIARLEQAIEQLGADLEPPPGWEARVLAAVEPRRRSWLARGWLAIPAVAAIALVVALSSRAPRRGEPLAVSAALIAGAQVMRGPSALEAIARGGGDHRALWIYRNGRDLAAACPGHPRCESSGDALRLVLDPVPIGSYQIIALGSAAALPAATGSLDRDLAAATAAGASWESTELEVK